MKELCDAINHKPHCGCWWNNHSCCLCGAHEFSVKTIGNEPIKCMEQSYISKFHNMIEIREKREEEK